MTLELYAKASGFSFLPSQFWASMPYMMAVVVLAVISARGVTGSEAPACLGRTFMAKQLNRVSREQEMSIVTRRNFMKTAAAGLAMPAIGRSAFAAEPLKVGYIFLGPIGDYGWTWAHNKGRLAMDAAFKGQVVSNYVENVKEDASAIPILKDLAQQGNKLIFTTSYGYMDQTLEVAKQFPNVMFEHCTGYKHAHNLGTYNSRFHQGRAVCGTLAGHLSKTGTIGYLGSYKVPEVVLGVNAFTLVGAGGEPEDHRRSS